MLELQETTSLSPTTMTHKEDKGRVKCFRPLTSDFVYFDKNLPVKWTWGLNSGSKGRQDMPLEDVPRTGLFIYEGIVHQKT